MKVRDEEKGEEERRKKNITEPGISVVTRRGSSQFHRYSGMSEEEEKLRKKK